MKTIVLEDSQYHFVMMVLNQRLVEDREIHEDTVANHGSESDLIDTGNRYSQTKEVVGYLTQE